jgi:hypothetical protein
VYGDIPTAGIYSNAGVLAHKVDKLILPKIKVGLHSRAHAHTTMSKKLSRLRAHHAHSNVQKWSRSRLEPFILWYKNADQGYPNPQL